MYQMIFKRPLFSFVIRDNITFIEKTSTDHWMSAKRVLCYLQNIVDYKIVYRKSTEPQLTANSDADCASSFDRNSTSGMLVYYCSNLVSCKSKKHQLMLFCLPKWNNICDRSSSRVQVDWLSLNLLWSYQEHAWSGLWQPNAKRNCSRIGI